MKISPRRVTTSIRWDGVHIKSADGKERVARVEGDAPEATPAASFAEGMLKGALVGLTGGYYSELAAGYKAAEGAVKAYDMTRKAGGDRWTTTKAAIKVGVLGGVKGFMHGFVDSLCIGLGTAAMVATFGPVGLLAAPVIGGIYNIAKDAIRH